MCVVVYIVLCYTIGLCYRILAVVYNMFCVIQNVVVYTTCVYTTIVLCPTIVLCYTMWVMSHNRCCVVQLCCVLPYRWCCTMYVVFYNCVVSYNCVLQYVLFCTIVLCCTIYVVIYDMITKLPKTQLLKFIKYSPMQH